MRAITTALILAAVFSGCREPELANTQLSGGDEVNLVADCYNDLYVIEASEKSSKVMFANGACKNGANRHSDWQTVRIFAIQSEVYVNDVFSSVDRSSARRVSVKIVDGHAYADERLIGSIKQVEGSYPLIIPSSGVCISLAINDDPYALESNSKDYPSESKHIFVHFSAQCR